MTERSATEQPSDAAAARDAGRTAGAHGDDGARGGLRPLALDDFVGQRAGCATTCACSSQAALGRGEALDHVLLHGPPGLGKTTLAQIVARELGVGFRATSGPVIARPGDLAAILTNLEPRDVLFIDEIHRLVAGGRGDPLSGDGGRQARPDHRRGAGGALDPHRPAAVHPGRRDHPRRADHDAAARALRHSAAARVLRRRRSGADRPPRRRACSALRAHRRRRARDRRAAPAARRASPIRLLRRVRDFAAVAGADLRRPRRRRRARCAARGRPRAASTPPTAATCAASPSSTAAARSASRRWRRRSPKSATRSRT